MASYGGQLADELRLLKDRVGASYDALGRRLNTSGSTLHRYCSGAAVPSTFYVVEQLARHGGADADEVARLRKLWELAAAEATVRIRPVPSVPAATGAAQPAGSTPPPGDQAPPPPRWSRLLRSGRNRLAWLVAGVAMLSVVVLALVEGPQLAARLPHRAAARTGELVMPSGSGVAGCVSRSGVRHTDPFHDDRVYTVDFLCPNDAHATLVSMSDFTTKVADMETTSSWFLCWTRRPAAGGGNTVWYYTQGDRITPGAERWVAWGFVAADQVHTAAHPVPGMPHC
jgi:Helix-turn-helix domain